MADNFITIDTTKRLASRLRACVDNTQNMLNLMADLKAIMDQQTDGVLYTTIEAQFGLPAGKGITTYNLLAGALAACNVSATQQFTDWLG